MTLGHLMAVTLLCVCAAAARADIYTDYIEAYGALADEQEAAHGIPSCITLAQGLLESAAGRSTLASEANNHFGIKCHTGWEGASVLRDDDAAGECFRAYATAAESYEDHSRFLLRRRYSCLFDMDASDYRAWAEGLSRCGYATDPHYADKLVAVIERYGLHLRGAGAEGALAEYIRSMLMASHPVCRTRGLHYVVAAPGDTYGSIAAEFGLDASRLLECNDVAADRPVRPWQEVYLQPKADTAPDGLDSAVIGQDEDMHSLSQRFGMRLSALRALNPRAADRPGTRLRLR